jgi:hypothetical protein
MAKLPVLSKLRVEDFPGAPNWVSPMFAVLNKFMDTVYTALSQGITLEDNLKSQVYTGTFKSTDMPISFRKTINVPAKACFITKFQPADGSIITVAPIWSWGDNGNGSITVNITNIPSLVDYSVSLLIL